MDIPQEIPAAKLTQFMRWEKDFVKWQVGRTVGAEGVEHWIDSAPDVDGRIARVLGWLWHYARGSNDMLAYVFVQYGHFVKQHSGMEPEEVMAKLLGLPPPPPPPPPPSDQPAGNWSLSGDPGF